ncbi:GNAT family N-acetyltransferase [Paenibacillus solisilvae]|uniref:GNAT family N-acetyltransferase n=1 Tax=Paenibacillus solisilvae TaxID=2486751 RepID=A0ABW0VUQ4_9BACL
MLDKSIPYYNVIMKRPKGTALPQFELPDGYSFERYTSGMEVKWAAIEASVGEFENNEESLTYFKKEYLPYSNELKDRLLFVLNKEGEPVGTITGWWNLTGERRDLSIHWFAVSKEYQGLGIGKALVSECIRNLLHLEGDKDVYLHTQTWSYIAIALYLKTGFNMEEKETFANYQNDYEQALPILQGLLNNRS